MQHFVISEADTLGLTVKQIKSWHFPLLFTQVAS